VKLLNAFAMMVGTLQISRTLADRTLADQVLDQGIRDVLSVLGAGASTVGAQGTE
jgi:TetR/AcrR family transcriptional regulator, transcriptional repressor for nem operon